MVSPRSILTSQSSLSSLRTTGIPMGQPSWTVLMSCTYQAAVLSGQISQPFVHWFVASICAEETYIEYRGDISHGCSVPK